MTKPDGVCAVVSKDALESALSIALDDITYSEGA